MTQTETALASIQAIEMPDMANTTDATYTSSLSHTNTPTIVKTTATDNSTLQDDEGSSMHHVDLYSIPTDHIEQFVPQPYDSKQPSHSGGGGGNHLSKPSLSQRDEQRFEENIAMNKALTVVALSRFNRTVSHAMPLYFGTDEIEFSIYRKQALRNRRLSSNANYPDGESETDHHYTRLSTRNFRVKIRASSFSSGPKAFKAPKASRDSMAPEPLRAPITTTSVKDLSPTPQSVQEASLPTASRLKWSEAIQRGLHKSSSNRTDSTPETAVSTAMTASTSTSIPPSSSSILTSGSPSGLSTSTSSTPQTDTLFTKSDNLSKPLGLVALKVMYDEKFLESIIDDNKSALVYPHGLINTGSICYMNSVIQMLLECEPFSQLLNVIRDNTVTSFESGSKTPLIDALLLLHDSFKKRPNSGNTFNGLATRADAVSPLGFYTAISKLDRFRDLEWGKQEDAEEFLGFLLDGLHEEFVTSLENLPMEEAIKFANSFKDQETPDRIVSAVKTIKNTRGKGFGAEAEDEEDATGEAGRWNEVGSNRKIAVRRTFEFKPSPIAQLFGGQFRSVLQMPNSKKSSITLDPFMHVQLDISDPDTTDLVTAFKKFSEVEEISYGNQKAKKQNLIDRLPKILIIHLKRFSFVTIDENGEGSDNYEIVSSKQKRRKHVQQAPEQEQELQEEETPSSYEHSNKLMEGRIEKIHKKIGYQHELNLPASCISTMAFDASVYKLVGVIYHHGRTAEGGHYTADVLEPSGDWIRLDDTQVSKITSEEVIENGINGGNLTNNNKSAYLLMYQKI
ncbi:hypothetical protein FOA43_000560 [Brettanomyces nanus]|uniref:Ubiquitin carboxyl-terminal hydrolase n=1 Tax=Eeniella nana TaxID=13502 RepID=A0A875RZC5_EENNA|nr:uncharacterized protein FOA43_000560 [Brettanomyces nanus]QPG73252.1 hypothetical protein FOA43_000560 [Brettanomyces nanus]